MSFRPWKNAPAAQAMPPDAILIAPTDPNQPAAPPTKAQNAGIPAITLDTFIGNGKYPPRAGHACRRCFSR